MENTQQMALIPTESTPSPDETPLTPAPLPPAPAQTDLVTRQVALAESTRGLDMMSMADAFAKSGLFKDLRSAAQALVKIQAGRELGLEPFQAVNGLYIIEGKVVMSANLMAALVVRSGKYRYRVNRIDNNACEIEFFFRDGQSWGSLGMASFTVEDAQRAALGNKDNWRKYPRNMFFARAFSNGVRWFCPDVFIGPAYTFDEFDIAVNEEGELDDKRIDWTAVQGKMVPPDRTGWHRMVAAMLYPRVEPFLVDQIKAAAVDPSVDNDTFTAYLEKVAADASVELPVKE